VVSHCYSEYLLTDAEEKKAGDDGAKPGKEHPDTGLGMIFRYPGNARKLRDATKIRLWREYLRGGSWAHFARATLTRCRQWTKRYPHTTTHLPQAHTRRPPEPSTRRNVGTRFWFILPTPSKPESIHRDAAKVFRARVAGHR
jgi:hypothetical protein